MSQGHMQAVDSLKLIDKTASQTRKSIAAKYSSPYLILWGCIAIIGYLLSHLFLRWVWVIWITLALFGGWLGMYLISVYQKRKGFPIRNSKYLQFWWQICAYWASFYVFGFITLFLFKPQSGIVLNAYIILVVMLAYIIEGIWCNELFMIVIGILVSTGTIVGVYGIPSGLYCFWMALVVGGVLVASGIYLHIKYS